MDGGAWHTSRRTGAPEGARRKVAAAPGPTPRDGGPGRAGAGRRPPPAPDAAALARAVAGFTAGEAACPEAARLAGLLRGAALDGTPAGARVLDAAARLLAAELVRRGAVPAAFARHTGGLAGWRLRRVQEAMEAAVARPGGGGAVALGDLAALVGLSPAHFCTAFRQSTGLPPHAWQRRRRTERAKAMLADPAVSLTEVALACGYGSSSHFSTGFRHETGLTPTAYRRGL